MFADPQDVCKSTTEMKHLETTKMKDIQNFIPYIILELNKPSIQSKLSFSFLFSPKLYKYNN